MATTRTYAQLQKEIASLQAQADKLMADEKKGVIERIREAIGTYAIMPAELFGRSRGRPPKAANGHATLATPTRTRKAAKKAPARKARPMQYRNPETGEEWNGWGKPPNWLREKADRTAFLINKPQ